MKTFGFIFCVLFFFNSFLYAQQTYKVGDTEYYYNQYYSTTGKPKVKRSSAHKKEFLNNLGYTIVPYGFEIDHIIPLSQGGSDSPYNMQLLTVEQHKVKTAKERSRTSSVYPSRYYSTSTGTKSYSVPDYYNPVSYSLLTYSTYSIPTKSTYSSSSSSRTYYTGSRGGTYYINSNGNKTYVKK